MSPPWYDRLIGSPEERAANAPREILVVDDHAEVREMVGLLLERLGWTVRKAASGREALLMMGEGHDAIGLALVDVMLPDTDGMSLARSLRGKYPRLAIALLSGQLNEESRWIVSEEGFRFLSKPFNFDQLRDLVAGLLGDSASPSP